MEFILLILFIAISYWHITPEQKSSPNKLQDKIKVSSTESQNHNTNNKKKEIEKQDYKEINYKEIITQIYAIHNKIPDETGKKYFSEKLNILRKQANDISKKNNDEKLSKIAFHLNVNPDISEAEQLKLDIIEEIWDHEWNQYVPQDYLQDYLQNL